MQMQDVNWEVEGRRPLFLWYASQIPATSLERTSEILLSQSQTAPFCLDIQQMQSNAVMLEEAVLSNV